MSWVGVDLDGTLATYSGWVNVDTIGEPILPMVERVKDWLAKGVCVKIFTARIHGHGVRDIATGEIVDALTPIQNWCRKHIGKVLPVTNIKDFGMLELWDDRAVQIISNTGKRADGNE